jgi:hypothetical protein
VIRVVRVIEREKGRRIRIERGSRLKGEININEEELSIPVDNSALKL